MFALVLQKVMRLKMDSSIQHCTLEEKITDYDKNMFWRIVSLQNII